MFLVNKTWVAIIVIVLIVAGLGYFMRHQIKSMFVSPAPAPAPITAVTPTATSSATVPTNNIYKTASSAKGSYLTDLQGKTLYVFDKDTQGVSNCTGACSTIWPAYTSGATVQKTFPTNITVIKDSNGTMQFAWKGMPLYYYSKDAAPGDTLGDGVGGIWHLAKP